MPLNISAGDRYALIQQRRNFAGKAFPKHPSPRPPCPGSGDNCSSTALTHSVPEVHTGGQGSACSRQYHRSSSLPVDTGFCFARVAGLGLWWSAHVCISSWHELRGLLPMLRAVAHLQVKLGAPPGRPG